MFSSSSLLQRAARHTPRQTFGVTARSFSAGVVRQNNGAQSSADNRTLIDSLRAADTTGLASDSRGDLSSQARPLRPFLGQSFVTPGDFGVKARTYIQKPYRKQSLLGPPRAEAEQHDVFRQLNIDPVREATNSALMSAFVSEMGKIYGRAETKLTWRSQRKVGKAIRRAKMMGIIPMHSRRSLYDMRNMDKTW